MAERRRCPWILCHSFSAPIPTKVISYPPFGLPFISFVHTTSGHEEALLLDSSQLKPLMMKELHYVEVEDVLTLPFPRTIRERLEEVEREVHEEKKRKEEKSQKRAAKSLTKRAGSSLRRRKDN